MDRGINNWKTILSKSKNDGDFLSPFGSRSQGSYQKIDDNLSRKTTLCAMCHIAEEIMKELKGLKFSFLNEGKESIATTNGEANFEEAKEKIREILLKKRGELIELEGIGSITDLGQREAEIEMGYYAEFYCYDCMSATFIRLWKERALFMKKIWVSVDIDEISDSLWFR